MASIPSGSPHDEAPHERVRLMDIPPLFSDVRDAAVRLSDLDFRSLMTPLLRQCCGLAGVAHAASCTEEAAIQDVQRVLEVLADYVQTALALWERWQAKQDAGARGAVPCGSQP